MTNSCSEKEFIREYVNAIKTSRASVFIGSGLSRQAGYKGWQDILEDVAQVIGLNVKKESDLISLAEYYVNAKKNRSKIDEAISEFFSCRYNPTESHTILASLPIISYWTTNYDKLIERTFELQNLTYSVLTNDESFKKYIDGKNRIIHKLHGDVETPNEAVITKKDYEEFAYKHEILLAKLKGEMCSKSFLFLGYSFTDTDIRHILTRIRLFYKGFPAKTHYCILEKIKRKTDDLGNYVEEEEDFIYRTTKQEHHILDLLSYGIQTILVDSYEKDIPRLLREIRRKVYSNYIYIAGAYDENNIHQEEYNQYARTLSTWMVTSNYYIISGYGKGIGPAVVSGAHEGYLLKRGHQVRSLGNNLQIYPFPYKQSWKKEEREKINTEIREKLLSKAGICLIINGTKKFNKKEMVSEGVVEEALIAKRNGLLIIPIAVTGGAALTVWEKISKDDTEYTRSNEFKLLKEGNDFDTIYSAVRKIITNYTGGFYGT